MDAVEIRLARRKHAGGHKEDQPDQLMHASAFDQRLENAAQAGAVAAAGRGRGADVDGTLRRGPSLSRHEQSTGLSFELRKETFEPVNEIGWRRPVRAGSTSCGGTAGCSTRRRSGEARL